MPLQFGYLAMLRVLGWLTLRARPGLRQRRRDPHPAPPGRRAPAPGKDTEAVLGRAILAALARLLPRKHLRQLPP